MTSRISKAILSVAAFSLAGCASASGDNCIAGQACTLVGKAIIWPYSDAQEAWLEQEHGCVVLALRPDTYDTERTRWNGRRVTVTGTAFMQPAGTFLFYDIEGRRVNGGACNAKLTLIVREISELAGH